MASGRYRFIEVLVADGPLKPATESHHGYRRHLHRLEMGLTAGELGFLVFAQRQITLALPDQITGRRDFLWPACSRRHCFPLVLRRMPGLGVRMTQGNRPRRCLACDTVSIPIASAAIRFEIPAAAARAIIFSKLLSKIWLRRLRISNSSQKSR